MAGLGFGELESTELESCERSQVSSESSSSLGASISRASIICCRIGTERCLPISHRQTTPRVSANGGERLTVGVEAKL